MLRLIWLFYVSTQVIGLTSQNEVSHGTSALVNDIIAYISPGATTSVEEKAKNLTRNQNINNHDRQPITHLSTMKLTPVSSTTLASTVAPGTKQNLYKHCLMNFGQCLNKNSIEQCARKSVVVNGICGDANKLCCIENQETQQLWEKSDGGCKYIYGTCQHDSDHCDGLLGLAPCGGPSMRKCCSPGEQEIEKWIQNDTKCHRAIGKCQISTLRCEGNFQHDMCGGPINRQCCLPNEETRTKWMTHDLKCHEKWGTCKATETDCNGGLYEAELCGGPMIRKCCVPSPNTVSSWSVKETACTNQFGTCQHDVAECNGTKRYDEGFCQGPPHRICCFPPKLVTKSWSTHDTKCLDKQGSCQHKNIKCAGKYDESILCGGPENRQCCIHAVQDDSASSKIIKIILLTGIGVLLFLGAAWLINLMNKRGAFKRYKRIKDLNWYTNNESSEIVKLTSRESDRGSYA